MRIRSLRQPTHWKALHISESSKQEKTQNLLGATSFQSQLRIQTTIKNQQIVGGNTAGFISKPALFFLENPSPWSSNCLQPDFKTPFSKIPQRRRWWRTIALFLHNLATKMDGTGCTYFFLNGPGFSMSLEATFTNKK